jgi:hypothetical protein
MIDACDARMLTGCCLVTGSANMHCQAECVHVRMLCHAVHQSCLLPHSAD